MRLSDYLVPSAHIVAISGLAFTLIVVVIARSPFTHGNFSPEGYDRTVIAHVGIAYPFDGMGLANPGAVITGDPASDGSYRFFQYGCASCHGIDATGGAVGPDLPSSISASKLLRETRRGADGMPAYPVEAISDEVMDQIIAFLKNDER